jgi:hypothetical protein
MRSGKDELGQVPERPRGILGRRLSIPVWVVLAAIFLPALLGAWVMLATEDDSNIALSRNEVLTDDSGARSWYGTMTNQTESQYREVAVVIRFLDGDGKPVAEVSGTAGRMEPGDDLKLQAVLPEDAVQMQVYSLQWRTGTANVGRLLGPWAPWQFGYLQYQKATE